MIDTSAMQQMEMVARSHHIGSPHFYHLTGCSRRRGRTGLSGSALLEDLHIHGYMLDRMCFASPDVPSRDVYLISLECVAPKPDTG